MAQNDLDAMKAAVFERIAEDPMDGLSPEDLADAMSHPKAAEVVAELMPFEASSVQQGEPARERQNQGQTMKTAHAWKFLSRSPLPQRKPTSPGRACQPGIGPP